MPLFELSPNSLQDSFPIQMARHMWAGIAALNIQGPVVYARSPPVTLSALRPVIGLGASASPKVCLQEREEGVIHSLPGRCGGRVTGVVVGRAAYRVFHATFGWSSVHGLTSFRLPLVVAASRLLSWALSISSSGKGSWSACGHGGNW